MGPGVKLSEAAGLMGASALGANSEVFDKEITGFALDSRAVARGELFFALSPEDLRRHCFTDTSAADAHRFIPQAFEGGVVACVARADLMDWKPGAHASTFGGNPVAIAAALKTIELLEGGLVANAAEVGDYLQAGLRRLMQKHDCIGDVRGLGLMVGCELVRGGGSRGGRSLGVRVSNLVALSEDARGRVYVTSLGGAVYRFAAG